MLLLYGTVFAIGIAGQRAAANLGGSTGALIRL